VQVNGLKVRLESLVGIMGFMLGGWLTDHYGYTIVIVLDGASFLFSAWILMRLRWEEQGDNVLATSKAASSFHVTLRYLRDTPVLLTISLLAFLVSLSTSAYNYGLPFLADQLRDSDATLHGLMWTAMSVGGLIGSYVAARLRVKLVNGMLVAYAVFSVGIVGAFAANHAVFVLLLLIFAGLFSGAAQVYESTLLQQAQNELRGKVMGVQGLLSRSGYFAGFLMAPFLAGASTLFGMLVFAQLLFVTGLIGFGLYLVFSPKK
ncbi:MFS transporter, partial [Brevibacillus sp. MS2.2]|uniref:MFS transporter n=1 Tax=Brevibacillus sp. MS2.2 TaxID=2738981 RepID=UPI00156BC0E3